MPRESHRLRWAAVAGAALAGIAASVLWACEDPTRPRVDGPALIVIGNTRHPVMAVGLASKRAVPVGTGLPWYSDGYTTAPDGRLLVHMHVPTPSELVEIDPGRLRVNRRIRFPVSVTDTLRLFGSYGRAVSLDGRHLYLEGQRDGAPIVAALDLHTLTPSALAGPFWVAPRDGIKVLRTEGGDLHGTLAVLASRGYRGATRLFFLRPTDLSIADSVAFTLPGGEPDTAHYMAVSPDGGRIYVASPRYVYAYDVHARAILAKAPTPIYAPFVVTPRGDRLLFSDWGDFPDYPGDGLIRVLSADLQTASNIDLRSLGDGPFAHPLISYIVFGEESNAYVSIGTPVDGPLYKPQPFRVVVINLDSNEIESVIEIGGYGTPQLAFRP